MQKSKLTWQNGIPFLLISIILVLGAAIYWPGIAGGFLFDDYPNLKELNRISVQDNFWQGVGSYVNSGFSGPTKRPVALVSFLLEYPSWPQDPAPFKRNNILFHLATSLLVFWFSLLIADRAKFAAGTRALFALSTTALFTLHPLYVSTVLYVIQRMTILATFFSLAALIAYLKAANALAVGRFGGWLLVFFLYPLLVLLAVFSKETGILVAFFTAVIALCFPLDTTSIRARFGRWGVLAFQLVTFAPAILLVLAMAAHFVQVMATDPELARRDFTVIERLLTQPRVIFSYLYDFFIPKLQSSGVYHDNFRVSKSLLSPPATLFAILAIGAAIALAVWKRRVAPFFALAVLGYFAGHALESSYIGLEMYFEHRNYMPGVFLLLGLSAGLASLWTKRSGAAVAGLAVVVVWLGFATYQQVQLWKDPLLLSLVWAEKSGGSERSLLDAANQLQQAGHIPKALSLVEEAIEKNPGSARAVLYGIVMECRYGVELKGVDLAAAKQRLRHHVYHQATYNYLKTILRDNEKHACASLSSDDLRGLINSVFSSNGISSGNIQALQYYELGNLDLLNRDGKAALAHYQQALSLRGDVQVGVVEVARLASAGFPELALAHIEEVRLHGERVLKNAQTSLERQQYAWIGNELSRLEKIIQVELAGRSAINEVGEQGI